MVSFKPDPSQSDGETLGPGVPDDFSAALPYRYGFGLEEDNPLSIDLTETKAVLAIARDLGVKMFNITLGSPYYNPHLTRPAIYPPSDGYQPPEDPLVGVMRHLAVTRELKQAFPELMFMGSGYTYLQEFLPNVAQAVIREGWVDLVGLGRLVLSYPELPADVLAGRTVQRKRLCRALQRLHDRAAQRHRLGLLSARPALQEVARDGAGDAGEEGGEPGMTRIAVIGTGIMGAHLARRLANAGFAVTGWESVACEGFGLAAERCRPGGEHRCRAARCRRRDRDALDRPGDR